MAQVQVGEKAPEFSLPDARGEPVRLADFRGRSEVVLFFYPKDYSPICTAEACSFRDSYELFSESGAEVIGISADSSRSHQRFAAGLRLPFSLLSDPGGRVRRLYGVSQTWGILPGRATFVIDREGVIRHVFSSQFRPGKHVAEALAVLRKLRGGQGAGRGAGP
jgi:peroxiredoxin Q/BCP